LIYSASGVSNPGFLNDVGLGLGAELSAAGGHWEPGAKPPAAGSWGLEGKAPAAGDKRSGGGAPSAGQFLQFFKKNNAFLCILRPNRLKQ